VDKVIFPPEVIYYIHMKSIIRLVSSRANWSIAAMFIIGGIEAVTGFIPGGMLPVVEMFLGILAIYFVRNPSQKYGK